jgi:hypothetical protein
VVRRAPAQFGHEQSRWQLRTLLASCPWLRLGSLPGLWRLLERLGIRSLRGRDYVHSPDPHYSAKLDLIEQVRLRAWYAPEHSALLYLDEVSFYRQPSLSYGYEASGEGQPLARRSYRSNSSARVVGALDALTGAVHYRQRSHIDTPTLAGFWYDLRQAYPSVETLYVVVDNWPVHFHPAVLAPLQPQQWPFPPTLPANWPTLPSRTAQHDSLPIQLLCLPTYASWLNPIEKLWRWLRQDVLHLHRLADDWPALKQAVIAFLDQFSHGSNALLRYVGLLPN